MIDKGITKAVLTKIEALNGAVFTLPEVLPKKVARATAQATLTRAIEKDIIERTGVGTYQAKVKNVVAAYYARLGRISDQLNRSIQQQEAATRSNGGENIRKERIAHGPNTFLIYWGEETLLATPVKLVPKSVMEGLTK